MLFSLSVIVCETDLAMFFGLCQMEVKWKIGYRRWRQHYSYLRTESVGNAKTYINQFVDDIRNAFECVDQCPSSAIKPIAIISIFLVLLDRVDYRVGLDFVIDSVLNRITQFQFRNSLTHAHSLRQAKRNRLLLLGNLHLCWKCRRTSSGCDRTWTELWTGCIRTLRAHCDRCRLPAATRNGRWQLRLVRGTFSRRSATANLHVVGRDCVEDRTRVVVHVDRHAVNQRNAHGQGENGNWWHSVQHFVCCENKEAGKLEEKQTKYVRSARMLIKNCSDWINNRRLQLKTMAKRPKRKMLLWMCETRLCDRSEPAEQPVWYNCYTSTTIITWLTWLSAHSTQCGPVCWSAIIGASSLRMHIWPNRPRADKLKIHFHFSSFDLRLRSVPQCARFVCRAITDAAANTEQQWYFRHLPSR